MGILDKLAGNKDKNVHYNLVGVKQPVDQDQDPPTLEQAKYTRGWLNKVALFQNLPISNDDKKVDGILRALAGRNGQCPCGGNGSQFQCPCERMRERGICTCGLFKTVPPREIRGTSVAEIKRDE